MSRIRQATPDDAKPAAALIYAAITDLAPVLTGYSREEDILATLATFFRQTRNRLSYQHTLLAEEDESVVGLIVVYHGRDAESIDQPIIEYLRDLKGDSTLLLDREAELDEFYIDTLSVDPHFSGRGIGTGLIQAAEAEAHSRHYERIALNVDKNNQRALRLYQYLGYQTDKETYIHHQSYFHMVKDLA